MASKPSVDWQALADMAPAPRHNIVEWGVDWLDVDGDDGKMPSTESFIDVKYLDGSYDFGVRPSSVNMIEVEAWRESQYRIRKNKKEYLRVQSPKSLIPLASECVCDGGDKYGHRNEAGGYCCPHFGNTCGHEHGW